MKEIKAETREIEPVFTLYGGNGWDSSGDMTIKVYSSDLEKAKVGDSWYAYNRSNMGRGEYNNSAEVVYKKEDGILILFTSDGTTNEANPQDWEGEPELVWYYK